MSFKYSSLIVFILLIGCSKKTPQDASQNPGAQSSVISSQTTTVVKTSSNADIRIVTEEPDPRICDYIDDAMGFSVGKDLAEAQVEARKMLKAKGLAMGGNTIRLDTNTVDDPGLIERGQVVLNGRVFKCDLSINPEALLGPIDRTIAAQPKESLTSSSTETKTDTVAATPSSTTTTKESTTTTTQAPPPASAAPKPAQTTNPPAPPAARFDEKSFLNSGEDEFEG